MYRERERDELHGFYFYFLIQSIFVGGLGEILAPFFFQQGVHLIAFFQLCPNVMLLK